MSKVKTLVVTKEDLAWEILGDDAQYWGDNGDGCDGNANMPCEPITNDAVVAAGAGSHVAATYYNLGELQEAFATMGLLTPAYFAEINGNQPDECGYDDCREAVEAAADDNRLLLWSGYSSMDVFVIVWK